MKIALINGSPKSKLSSGSYSKRVTKLIS